jgi:histidinol-phosphatase
VAQGLVEVALSYGTEVWDVAALALLVEEAGGRWSDVRGGNSLSNGSFLTSNGPCHDEFVRDLASG